MIFIKNIVALGAILIGVATLYLAMTVPVIVASSYLLLAIFCVGILVLSTWSLSNVNKVWLSVFTILWAIMMVLGNGAV